MAMNPVLALINCDSEDKFVRDIAEAYFQNPVHVRDLLTEDCIEACLDDYMRNQDVIADVRDLSSDCNNEAKLSHKQRRAARRVQNKRHKQSDRAHGKKRMPSAKFIREADNHQQDIYHAHAKFVWHENRKGEWIPRTVRKHDKFRQERFVPSPDWDGTPDPLMPAERLERNQQIEQLKNQLAITDWEMRDVTDRIQWCREDIEEIEFMKSKEAEVRQSLKEWQDRLDTLAREYHDLTERILNLSV